MIHFPDSSQLSPGSLQSRAVEDRRRRSVFFNRRLVCVAVLCGLLIASPGCSKEKLKEALEDAKTQTKALTESTVQAIEEELPARGSMTLETTPITPPIGRLDLELIAIGDGRPNVVQIVTYPVSSPNRNFPAVMLHGTTDVGTAGSLVGETIACEMYYQADANAQIAMTRPGERVSVTFDSYDDGEGSLSISIAAGELLDAKDQTISLDGGQATAVVRDSGE